jgi:hypothetical protein
VKNRNQGVRKKKKIKAKKETKKDMERNKRPMNDISSCY